MELHNLLSFKDFDNNSIKKSDNKVSKDILKESTGNGWYLIYSADYDIKELDRGVFENESQARDMADELYVEHSGEISHYDVEGPFSNERELDKWKASYEISVPESKVHENYTVDAEKESGNLFGFAQVKNSQIKKIGAFTDFTKVKNPPPVRERPILNAGRFIDNGKVKGFINRIEGSKVFVESVDEPGEIVEVSIKDAIKVKPEEKQHTAVQKLDQFQKKEETK